jgi:CheY-like chemotaxis protein
MAKHSSAMQAALTDRSAENDPPASPTAASAASPAQAGAVHVLVVDDESVIRSVVRMALEDAGYVVHEAPDGQIAMEQLMLSPQPLVVVLDLMMPHMSGTEVLEFLANEPVWAQRHTVVVLTAVGRWLNSKNLKPLFEHLAIALVAKPFDIEELLEAVTEAAGRLSPA